MFLRMYHRFLSRYRIVLEKLVMRCGWLGLPLPASSAGQRQWRTLGYRSMAEADLVSCLDGASAVMNE